MSSSSKVHDPIAARAAQAQRGPAASHVLGSWELVSLAGEGEITAVYRARPHGSQAPLAPAYAVKVLREAWRDNRQGLSMLARETHISRKVAHPHLVPILSAQLNEPPHYLVMPLLDGYSLATRLQAEVPLELPVAFWLARQAAEALAALHRAGWTHCDVKPSNILVSPGGHATLIDLGFARHADERKCATDRPVLGTMSYIAPEMLYSATGGDYKSDVYSLGVTLFEMLTGRVPFDGEDMSELALQHRQALPGNLRQLAPHLPTRAARLVQQMLAKEPLRRPSPADVIERLTALEIETFAERLGGA